MNQQEVIRYINELEESNRSLRVRSNVLHRIMEAAYDNHYPKQGLILISEPGVSIEEMNKNKLNPNYSEHRFTFINFDEAVGKIINILEKK